jgi:hypothetical protein
VTSNAFKISTFPDFIIGTATASPVHNIDNAFGKLLFQTLSTMEK